MEVNVLHPVTSSPMPCLLDAQKKMDRAEGFQISVTNRLLRQLSLSDRQVSILSTLDPLCSPNPTGTYGSFLSLMLMLRESHNESDHPPP